MQIKKKNFILLLAGMFFAGAIVMGGICAAMMHSPGYTMSNDDKLAEIKGYIDQYYLNDYDEQIINVITSAEEGNDNLAVFVN